MNQSTWLESFRQFLHYCVPPITPSPALDATSIAAVLLGIYLTFRATKSERLVVGGFGFLLGGWIGWRLAELVGTPGPVTAALCGVVLTVVAYRTYRYWLMAGSVLLLFAVGLLFQLGRGDLQRYLPAVNTTSTSGKVELPSAEEQFQRSHPDIANQMQKVKERLIVEIKSLGATGWLLPAVAAIVGALLAYWSLRIFAIVWLGLVGATLAVLGALTFASAHWPNARNAIFGEPRLPLAVLLVLWLTGLIIQAKAARLPVRKPAPAKAAETV